jgi:nitrite reductase (NO-forming)
MKRTEGPTGPKPWTYILIGLVVLSLLMAAAAAAMALGAQRTLESLTAEEELAVGPAQPVDVEDISRPAWDLPPPIQRSTPETVVVYLEALEVVAEIEPGVTYSYWTFNGTVPGPFIRVMEGDTVELRLSNSADSIATHSIDLHAVNGPGGGSVLTQVPPGEEKVFHFKATHPGLYIYHCATQPIDMHITNGMYGLILVEPQGGLPPVDVEYYVVQGELYTTGSKGQPGHHLMSAEKLLAEEPEYVVFNGRVGALTEDGALTAEVGDTVRIFFGVGGPNLVSSFHVIGEIFDRVYIQASLSSPPLRNIQTTLVPAGGAVMVEFEVQVPGTYLLVDHSLTRTIQKGSLGVLVVSGPESPELYGEGEATQALVSRPRDE